MNAGLRTLVGLGLLAGSITVYGQEPKPASKPGDPHKAESAKAQSPKAEKAANAAAKSAPAAAPSKKEWKPFASKEGAFSVELPGPVTTETPRPIDTPDGPSVLHMFTTKVGSATFVVSYNDYPEAFIKKQTPETLLDNVRQGQVAQLRGKLDKEDKLMLEQAPGRQVEVTALGNYKMASRFYLVKNRLYQMVVVDRDTSFSETKADAERVFKSFKLTGEAPAPPKP